MKTFKVWIHIEECREDRGEYREACEPVQVGEYTTYGAAANMVANIQDLTTNLDAAHLEVVAKNLKTIH